MGERILRGSRLGTVSYEVERDSDLAPRQVVTYECATEHQSQMMFAAEAEVPSVWECRVCGRTATIVDGNRPEPKKVKPSRTHWDMLMERRTTDQLEEVLTERLDVLRGKTGRRSA
jgi:thioesterase domain-containing protein